MSGIITTGNHPKALWPGIKSWFGKSYDEFPAEYSSVFEQDTSDKAYEEDVESTGFGLLLQKNEGGSISYDSDSQGAVKRYTHITYAKGYIVTMEELQDNQYEYVSKRRSRALAFSARQTKEIVHANVFNLATTAGYTGADGKTLLATDHPSLAGDLSNKLSVAADLSEASLEDLFIQIMMAYNARGLRIALTPEQLIVPPQLAFEAERIIKSNLQNDTANNAINAIRSKGMLPKGYMVYHYLTDADAWFVQTNCPDGLKTLTRMAGNFEKDNDFDTKNAKASFVERYSCGWTDWRGLWGSEGAG